MMLLLGIVFILYTQCSALTTELDKEWKKFKEDYNKQYTSPDLEFYRREIWEANYDYINEHNKQADTGLHTYWLGMNQFGDLTNKEFTKTRGGYIMPEDNLNIMSEDNSNIMSEDDLNIMPEDNSNILPEDNSNILPEDSSNILPKDNLNILPEDNFNIMPEDFEASFPTEVDWRKKGYVTPVQNEGDCGSSWAFSALGALEGQHFKATGQLRLLSTQNLIDCSQKEGTFGCEGGFMDAAFQYIKLNKGVDTAAAYPYRAKQGKCRFTKQNIGATLSSYVHLPAGSEINLQKAVAEVGPVSVAIDDVHSSYQFYKKGVYYEPKCNPRMLSHANLVTGYGVYNKTDYWIVKDSYGTNWGMAGYIMMSRNRNNNCGIASLASYPVV